MNNFIKKYLLISFFLVIGFLYISCARKEKVIINSDLPNISILNFHLGESLKNVKEELKEYGISAKTIQIVKSPKIIRISCNSESFSDKQLFYNYSFSNISFDFFEDKLIEIVVRFNVADGYIDEEKYLDLCEILKNDYKFSTTFEEYNAPHDMAYLLYGTKGGYNRNDGVFFINNHISYNYSDSLSDDFYAVVFFDSREGDIIKKKINKIYANKDEDYNNISQQKNSGLPKVAIIGCHLGDSIETVRNSLKEYNISASEEEYKESLPNKSLKFFDIHVNKNDIPSALTFGNLKIHGIRYRFWNEKLCQIQIYFDEPSKTEFEELCGAFKKKYHFPTNRTSYHGPKEFQYVLLMDWYISDYDTYKDEYDYYYSMGYKRIDGIIFFDYWVNSTPQIGIFDSKQGDDMIKFLKQKKAKGEKDKQSDIF